jgi:tetratricopeptide (TPR) repeat protein
VQSFFGHASPHTTQGFIEVYAGAKRILKIGVATGMQVDREISEIFGQGLSFHQRGQFAQAKAAYEQVLKVQYNHFDALHLLGVVNLQTKNLALAEELIGRAIEIYPHVATAHSNLGNVLRELKRFDDALASYEKAIALKPDYADAFFNRGNALKELKRLDDALASYDKAIALKPDFADAFLNRGNALKELKRLDDALASYDKAIALKPDYADAFFNRANVLQKQGKIQPAIRSCIDAISLDNENENFVSQLRDIFFMNSLYGAAAACQQRIMEIKYPNNSDIEKLLRATYAEQLSFIKDKSDIYVTKDLNSKFKNDEIYVIILCGGEATRWGGYLGEEIKQLIQVEGEILILRTIKELNSRGLYNITILCRGEDENKFQSAVCELANVCSISSIYRDGNPSNKYSSSENYWVNGVKNIILLGDVYYTSFALDKIIHFDDAAIQTFGRRGASTVTGCKYGEIFAFSFTDTQKMGSSIALLRQLYEAKICTAHASGWSLNQIISNTNPNFITAFGNFTEIDDWTEDFDFPEDYIIWSEKRKILSGN